ncbi:MAG: aminotransferase class V-fold PLP-dependent enzyme [Pseudomonadota bacterium]|jgi:aromatic-L-amino-acid decarboxylase|nr:MAG: aspartate aminotransferase family protein [Pseudomonadota bacterium]
MTPEEFRRFGHELIDRIADYRARVYRGEFPVMARVEPGALRASLPQSPPEEPEPFSAVLEDLERLVLPACTHWQDPRFCAYFPSNSSLAAVLGDFASTGLAQLGLNWQASPALTELEELTVDWLRQMMGLSAAWKGVIQDTASAATLVALICARERATRYGAVRGGLQQAERPLAVYASTQAHSSVEKAALLAGFGRENLRLIDVDEQFALRPDALEEAIATDLRSGVQPCAVVATVGTTATTALDPIAEVARIARAHGLWLHVDAAMAGSAMLLPECRWMWNGIEEADSLVVNPHKWLGASFDCSTYFVRDPQHLVRVMSSNPSYLRTDADAVVTNFRDWGIPLGRRFRALKLWFLIREQGVSGLQRRLRRDLAHARWLAEQVDAAPDWKRIAPVHLQTVCVLHTPPGLEGEALDAHTLAWLRRINESGAAYLTPAHLGDRWVVRVALGTEATEHEHVAGLWQLMQSVADATWKESRR